MMKYFEAGYIYLIEAILNKAELRETRNGKTYSSFSHYFKINIESQLPVLIGRKIHLTGIKGELSAMLRKPKNVQDFKAFDCNYWDLWGDSDGNLNLDYGNEWYANDQIAQLKHDLKHNPASRRMLIDSWNPSNIKELTLPCCHFLYQFYVDNNNCLSMNWYQRSVDVMIGLPSNFIFASILLVIIANEFNYKPKEVNFMLGDCHIYEDHTKTAKEYIDEYKKYSYVEQAYQGEYRLLTAQGSDFTLFKPNDITIFQTSRSKNLEFELKK